MQKTKQSIRECLRLIKEDWNVHARDSSRPGFRAMAVYRYGVWEQGFRIRILRFFTARLYWFLFRYIRNHYGIELHRDTVVGRRLLIGHQNGIVIHRRAVIGDDCVIRQNVTIGAVSQTRIDEAPILGNRVELGCGAAILGRVTIGDDTRIGPYAVVMTNVPAGSSVVGSPPRIISMKLAKSDPLGNSTLTEVS